MVSVLFLTFFSFTISQLLFADVINLKLIIIVFQIFTIVSHSSYEVLSRKYVRKKVQKVIQQVLLLCQIHLPTIQGKKSIQAYCLVNYGRYHLRCLLFFSQDSGTSEDGRQCLFCKKGELSTLKRLSDAQLETAKRAATRRSNYLKKDKFVEVTKAILDSTDEVLYYHSQCLSQYCAIKRSTTEPSNTSTTTRSSYSLSSTDKRGVLMDQCIFCGKKRKSRKKKKNHCTNV